MATWGYVRPEKQTVGDQHRGAATVAKTVAKPLNSTRRTWTTLEYRPSLRPVTDGPGRYAHSYGSEGWGFESLRARPAHRPVARPAAGFLVALGATGTRQPPNRARLIDSAAARQVIQGISRSPTDNPIPALTCTTQLRRCGSRPPKQLRPCHLLMRNPLARPHHEARCKSHSRGSALGGTRRRAVCPPE